MRVLLSLRIYIESWVCWPMLIIPALGRWRRVDPWASLAGQPSLFGDTQNPVRDMASKNKVDGFWGTAYRLPSGLHMNMGTHMWVHVCEPTDMCVHTHAHTHTHMDMKIEGRLGKGRRAMGVGGWKKKKRKVEVLFNMAKFKVHLKENVFMKSRTLYKIVISKIIKHYEQ